MLSLLSHKRIWGFLLLVILCFGCMTMGAQAEGDANLMFYTDLPDKEPSLYASGAVLMDGDSGRILYQKNGEAPLAPASTTKILTAILVLENCDLEETVLVSQYAASMPKVKLYIKKGESYKVGDLLYAMLLESYNDAAQALAEHVGGKENLSDGMEPGKAFAVLMNRKAEEIGCKDSWFITPNGLDATEYFPETGSNRWHHSTAGDLARIMRYSLFESEKADLFRRICGSKSYAFSANGRSFRLNNKNTLLWSMDGMLAGKTGFTNQAGYCYVGAVEKGEKHFVVALLGCGWPPNRGYKWKDMRKLIAYGESSYDLCGIEKFLVNGKSLPRIKVTEGVIEEAGLVIERKSEMVKQMKILMKADEKIETSFILETEIQAPAHKNEKVGEILYKLDTEIVYREDVLLAEEVENKGFFWYFEHLLNIFAKKMQLVLC